MVNAPNSTTEVKQVYWISLIRQITVQYVYKYAEICALLEMNPSSHTSGKYRDVDLKKHISHGHFLRCRDSVQREMKMEQAITQ